MSEELMTLRELIEQKLKHATAKEQEEVEATCAKMCDLLDYQYDTEYPSDALKDNYQLIYLSLFK